MAFILSAAWMMNDLDPLEETIEHLRMLSPEVIVIGSGIRFQANIQPLIFQSKAMNVTDVERFVDAKIAPFEYTFNELMRNRILPKTTAYVDVQAITCEHRCRLFTPDGQLMYIDYGHMTLAGSQFVADEIPSRYGNIFSSTPRVR